MAELLSQEEIDALLSAAKTEQEYSEEEVQPKEKWWDLFSFDWTEVQAAKMLASVCLITVGLLSPNWIGGFFMLFAGYAILINVMKNM